MAHLSTYSRAILARLLSAGVLPAAFLLLSTCAHDVTAPPVPTQLDFAIQPGSIMAGHQISPAVKVWAEDAHGNKVARFTGSVTVALGNNPGGSTLGGTTTVPAEDGVATFYDLSLNKTGTGYTLTASGSGLTVATSAGFDVAPGPATHLEFTVEPVTATAGAVLAPAAQVTALDAAGNPVPGFTGNVTVALGNPGASPLGGTATVTAVNGVASFGDLSVSTTGTGYWLTATATGLAKATSNSFDIIAGTPTQLVFGTEPGTTVAGRQITPAVKVRALDALGNLVPSFSGNVSVTLGSNPGGATLGGTTPVAAVNGVATFFDLSLNKTGTGYTLTVTASGFSPAASALFDITPGTPRQLDFRVEPTATVAGQPIAPAVQVSVLDASGNLAPSFIGSVTVTLGNNPGGSTLGGTATVAAVGGVASFSTLTLDKTAPGYWLTATATGLSTATSSSFNITAAAATQLVFGTQPGTTVAGRQITPAVKVRALDALGNLVPGFTASVTVVLGNNPGGGTLSGTTPVAAVGGVASFGDLSINKTAPGYTLTASGGGLGPVTSTAFDITPGTATQLAFTVQPGTTVAGQAIAPAVHVSALDATGNLVPGFVAGGQITPAVKVRALDALGNLVPGFTANVTITLGANPGGGTLSGTASVAAVGGVASFGDLSINKTAPGYTLTASGGGLGPVTSTAFDITPGTATQLA